MPKEIKGNARRTPPQPNTDHADIDEWFHHLVPDLVPIVRRVDEAIRSAIPELNYAVKYKRAFYGRQDLGWVIELAPYAVSVNVLFLAGADFDSPPPLGVTGRIRYVKITTVTEVSRPEVTEWLEQAGRIRGWRWPSADRL